MNQVSTIYALEKTLKVGIISGSLNSNVGSRAMTVDTKAKLRRTSEPSSRINEKVEESQILENCSTNTERSAKYKSQCLF